MSKRQTLRALVSERLTAAAEEIFALIEKTIAEYEEELCRSKEENERKQQILDQILCLQIPLHRADVKTEQRSVHISPRSDNLEEKTTQMFEVPAVQVKTEDDEQLSTLHQILISTDPDETVTNQEETHQDINQHRSFGFSDLQHSGDSSDTDDSKDWVETAGPSTQQMETEDNDENYKQILIGSSCVPTNNQELVMKLQQCSLCRKVFPSGSALRRHFLVHTGERPFNCPVCDKTFKQNAHLKVHMYSHTGLMPYSCSICSQGFTRKQKYQKHVATHKGIGRKLRKRQEIAPPCEERREADEEKTEADVMTSFICLQCNARFSSAVDLFHHTCVHNGENDPSLQTASINLKGDGKGHGGT